MASQDAQDRTQPASPRKLRKAREVGQIARSRDLGHFVAMAAGGAALVTCAPLLSSWMKDLLMQGLRFDLAAVQSTGFMGARLMALTISLLWVVIPFGALMAATGVAVYEGAGQTAAAVLALADGALYQAKKQGRDRFVIA